MLIRLTKTTGELVAIRPENIVYMEEETAIKNPNDTENCETVKWTQLLVAKNTLPWGEAMLSVVENIDEILSKC